MRRRAIVLAGCVSLGAFALPGIALAAGKMLGPAPAKFTANTDFRPKSAFGSPGGFPLPMRPDPQGGVPLSHFQRVPQQNVLPRHNFFTRFPITTFSYPTALYAPPVDTAPTVVNVAPVINVSPMVYVAAPSPSPAPVPVAAAVPVVAASQPSVVEYPTGRYELRGDG